MSTLRNRARVFLYLISAVLAMMIRTADAESELNLAKSTQNPLAVNAEARHYTLPFVNYSNFDNGISENTQNILDLKPVLPFPLSTNYDLILKTIIPITHQASGTGNGYINGIGDINPTAFVTPSMNSRLLWGLGPTLVLPTATNKALGAGKFSIGPELALIAMPDVWTFAILTYNIWSVAGPSDRPSINQFSFQYYITYNFQNGWYLTTQPNITSNWLAPTDDMWTVPIGAGAGRLFSIGHQPINFSIQGYRNIIRPSAGPDWTLQLTLEFLFPDYRTKPPMA